MKIFLLFLLTLTTSTNSQSTEDDTYAHLQNPTIREICSVKDRAIICASNNTNVCTARKNRGGMEYRDYENSCYLFLNNMCEYPGNEFYIAGSGHCERHLASLARQTNHTAVARRQINNETQTDDVTELAETEIGEQVNVSGDRAETPADDTGAPDTPGAEEGSETTAQTGTPLNVDKKPLKRMRLVTPSGRFSVSEAYDSHKCPGHCTEEYQPVCLIANRGFGMYFKYLTFLNHCQADMYYCGHAEEFAPPPGESEEMISGSRLDWSFCASYRFLQFARFSEVASSMGHYGWLQGHSKYKYSHILSPAEKLELSGAPRHVAG